MSDRLVEHLYNRITTQSEVRGTYHPTSGRYDPSVADDEQAALACYAIIHHARHLSLTRPHDNSPQLFANRAGRVVTSIAGRVLRAQNSQEPRVVALLLLAVLDSPAAEADPTMRDRLGELLIQQVHDGAADGGVGEGLNDGEIALSAAALATLYERTRQPEVGELARALMDRLWAQPDQAPNLAGLPWLVMAQDRAGALLAESDESGAYRAELARRKAILAQVIDRLLQRQVIEKPQLGPDDVLGGFVLTPGPPGSPPNPDWRNAQPLMFLAIALRDGEITTGRDKLGWLLSAGYSARFVGQLMMDEAACYYVRDRVAARGGVRMAPWDNRLALAPAAMSLLALSELQSTLPSFRPDFAPNEPADVVTESESGGVGEESTSDTP